MTEAIATQEIIDSLLSEPEKWEVSDRGYTLDHENKKWEVWISSSALLPYLYKPRIKTPFWDKIELRKAVKKWYCLKSIK